MTTTSLAVILVSPKGDLNIGSVARAMHNFGVFDLRIVDPRCALDTHACKQMAMHSYDIIRNAKIYETFIEAQADLHFSVAFSSRDDALERPCYFLPDFMKEPYQKIRGSSVGLVFGREESGLRLDELDSCDYQVSIPTGLENSSINLAMSVTIALSQIFFEEWNADESKMRSPYLDEPRPPKGSEERFFNRIQELIVKIGYANPQNPAHTIDDMKRIFHRAEVSDREMRILFGVLTGIEKKVEKASAMSSKIYPLI